MEPFIDSELIDAFIDQFNARHLEIKDCEEQLRTPQPSKEAYDTLLRCFHSLKGSARYLGLEHISQFCHEVESIISQLKDNELCYVFPIGEKILEAANLLEKFVHLLDDNLEDSELLRQMKTIQLFFQSIDARSSAVPASSENESAEYDIEELKNWKAPNLKPSGIQSHLENLESIIELINYLKRNPSSPRAQLEQAISLLGSLQKEMFIHLPLNYLVLNWRGEHLICTTCREFSRMQSQELQQELLEVANLYPKQLILDCANLSSIFSSMIGTLISIHKMQVERGGSFALARLNHSLLETLSNMGITLLMPCHHTLNAALNTPAPTNFQR